MKYLSLIVSVLYVSLISSCTKPIDLDLASQPPRLVVEGSIYNTPGPYIIRLTLSRNALSSRANVDHVTPVKNATVILSDNFGNIDTLVAPPDSVYGYAKWVVRREGDKLILDSVYRVGKNYYTLDEGYYQTSRITGVAERTYTLKILYDGQEYFATETMPSVAPIDTVGVGVRYSLKEARPYKIPRLYFRDPPDESNYYLAPIYGPGGLDEDHPMNVPAFSLRECFQATIFDDRLLNEYVDGIYIDQTCSKEQAISDIMGEWGNVYLTSLTKNHYDYIKVLFDQLKSDGGTFKPTPANPPTNISNGALGYFGASAVSRKYYFFKQ